jgi:hypothetical protein
MILREVCRPRRIGIATGYSNSPPGQQLSESAHAGARHSDEVDGARVLWGEECHGRRRQYSARPSLLSSLKLLEIGLVKYPSSNILRRVRTPSCYRRGGQARQLIRAAGEKFDSASEAGNLELVLRKEHSCAGLGQGVGIRRLMVRRRRRKGDENGRNPPGAELGQCAGA